MARSAAAVLALTIAATVPAAAEESDLGTLAIREAPAASPSPVPRPERRQAEAPSTGLSRILDVIEFRRIDPRPLEDGTFLRRLDTIPDSGQPGFSRP